MILLAHRRLTASQDSCDHLILWCDSVSWREGVAVLTLFVPTIPLFALCSSHVLPIPAPPSPASALIFVPHPPHFLPPHFLVFCTSSLSFTFFTFSSFTSSSASFLLPPHPLLLPLTLPPVTLSYLLFPHLSLRGRQEAYPQRRPSLHSSYQMGLPGRPPA